MEAAQLEKDSSDELAASNLEVVPMDKPELARSIAALSKAISALGDEDPEAMREKVSLQKLLEKKRKQLALLRPLDVRHKDTSALVERCNGVTRRQPPRLS